MDSSKEEVKKPRITHDNSEGDAEMEYIGDSETPVVAIAIATASNAASVADIPSDEARNGMAPARHMVAHSRLTSRKPKRGEAGGAFVLVAIATASASPPVKKAEAANAFQSS